MKKIIKKINTHAVAQAIVSILFGLFLLLWPQTTTLVLVYALAGYLAVTGILSFFAYSRRKTRSSVDSNLIAGIFELLLALILFMFPKEIAGIFSVILGAFIVLSGAVGMARVMQVKKASRDNNWLVIFLLNLFVIVGGVVIVVNPFSSAMTFVSALGVLLLAKGIIDLVTYSMFIASTKNINASLKK